MDFEARGGRSLRDQMTGAPRPPPRHLLIAGPNCIMIVVTGGFERRGERQVLYAFFSMCWLKRLAGKTFGCVAVGCVQVAMGRGKKSEKSALGAS